MIWENCALAFSSLKANKMRALLTMLGIIIGIGSVIAIVTIGNSMTSSVTSNLSSFGTSNISVYIQQKSTTTTESGGGMAISIGGGMSGGMQMSGGRRTATALSDNDLISPEMMTELKEEFPDDIIGISYTYSSGGATAKDNELYANISITGVSPDYSAANSVDLLNGRFIMDSDLDNYRYVCVVSDKLINNLMPDVEDPIGQQVKVYKTDRIELYTIIGVYEYQSSGFGDTTSEEDISTSFYIPVTTATRNNLQKNYSQITVVAGTDTDVISFSEELQAYFDELYANNTTWGVTITSMEEQLSTISDTLSTISLAIAAIAAISLVVGGIGVMNIMLVSVTERTREIGTRKALGAKNLHIRLQFVVEAIIISGIGGIIGVVFGSALGIVGASLMGVSGSISMSVVLFSVLFSMSIGVFFGIYPANKAAKLDPIEALRYE